MLWTPNASCFYSYIFLRCLKRTFNLLSVLNTIILIINLIVLYKTEHIMVFKDEWWVLYNVKHWTMFHIVNLLLTTNRKFLPDAWFRKTTIELPCSFLGLFFVLVNLVFVWFSSSGSSRDGECWSCYLIKIININLRHLDYTMALFHSIHILANFCFRVSTSITSMTGRFEELNLSLKMCTWLCLSR